MTCKDCYHYDVCSKKDGTTDYYGKEIACDDVDEMCKNFKDKSLIVELPCKVGYNFFIIAQSLEKGKYTEYFIDERQVSCFEYDGKKLTVYDFDEIDFDIDDVYLDKSKAEARLKELNNETS